MISDTYRWQCITPEAGHYTFGYYDRCAWDPQMRYHLALRIPQQRRLPEPGETATVGLIDMRNGFAFRPVAETRAWCHQQGSMTLFLKRRPDLFAFNDFEEAAGRCRPVTRVYDINGKLAATWPFNTYCHSPDGRWGASIDFSRITRRGYSYADAVPDPAVLRPRDDGVWLVDLEKGTRSLIVTYDDLIAKHPCPWEIEGRFLWLNHLIFNCDATRLMVLLRYYVQANQTWRTYMYTMRLDGSDLICSLPDFYWMSRFGGISHQIWGRTPREILIDPNWTGNGSDVVVYQEDRWPLQAERLSAGQLEAAHLVFSPNGEWIASHTYPNKGPHAFFALIRASDGAIFSMGTFRHQVPECTGDMRCDLHPRWSPDGAKITLDSIDSGERKIYMLDLEENRPG